MFRELVAERFPAHQVLAEEMGGAERAARPVLRSIHRRDDELHGLPIFARRSRSRSTAPPGSPQSTIRTARTVHGRARWRSAPERPAARVSGAGTLVDAMLVTGLLRRTSAWTKSSGCSQRSGCSARCGARSAAIDLCHVAAGRMDGFWESDLKPWDTPAVADRDRSGRPRDEHGREAFTSRGKHVLSRPTVDPRRDAGDHRRLQAHAAPRAAAAATLSLRYRTRYLLRYHPAERRFLAKLKNSGWHRSCRAVGKETCSCVDSCRGSVWLL